MLSGFLNKAVIDICCEAEHYLVTKFGEWAIQGELRLLFCEGAAAAGKGLAVMSSVAEARPRRGKSL